MNRRDFGFLAGGMLIGALVALTWLRFDHLAIVAPAAETTAKPFSSVPALVPAASTVRRPTPRERLESLPALDVRHPDPARGALVLEWLREDRAGAMAFLASNRFADLYATPGLSQAIGERATPAELLVLVNASASPWDSLQSVGRWITPAALNGLAAQSSSFAPESAKPATTAVAGLLAAVNLDRAVEFVQNRPTDELRGHAMAGVFDEVGARPNGDAVVRSLYGTLPPAIRAQDDVAASYGVAIWSSDPVAALQAVGGLQDPQRKKVVSVVLANASASSAPEVAVSALYQSGLSPPAIVNKVNAIMQNWFAMDPQAAANFLANSPAIPGADREKYGPGRH